MTITQKKIIDFLGIDKNTDQVKLGISDHLDWNEPSNDHLLLLQEKINDYLAFIESGELVEKMPAYKNKKVTIEVFGKYPLSPVAQEFYKKAQTVVASAGFELKFKELKGE